jgi:hypothetical protein
MRDVQHEIIRDDRLNLIGEMSRRARNPRPVGECKVCRGRTVATKPFCAEHLSHMDEVARICADIEAQELDRKIARKKPTKITLDNHLAHETIVHLENDGPLTLDKMAKILGVEHRVANGIATALAKLGVARLEKTPRGQTILHPAA